MIHGMGDDTFSRESKYEKGSRHPVEFFRILPLTVNEQWIINQVIKSQFWKMNNMQRRMNTENNMSPK